MTATPESSSANTSSIWHLYLIECHDGTYYTGITTDVERRFAQHLKGDGARYTRSHKPLRVLACLAIGTRSEALKAELTIKRLPKEEKVRAVTTLPVR